MTLPAAFCLVQDGSRTRPADIGRFSDGAKYLYSA
jgi:hypothetical protein